MPLSKIYVCRVNSSPEAFDAPHPAAVLCLAFVHAVALFRTLTLPKGAYCRMGWLPCKIASLMMKTAGKQLTCYSAC